MEQEMSQSPAKARPPREVEGGLNFLSDGRTTQAAASLHATYAMQCSKHANIKPNTREQAHIPFGLCIRSCHMLSQT